MRDPTGFQPFQSAGLVELPLPTHDKTTPKVGGKTNSHVGEFEDGIKINVPVEDVHCVS